MHLHHRLTLVAATALTVLLSGCATPLPADNPSRVGGQAQPAPAIDPVPPAAAPAALPADVTAMAAPGAEPVVKSVEDDLNPTQPLNLNAPEAQQDLWQRVRGGLVLPNLDGQRVEKWEAYYAKRPDYVARMMERGGRYLFHIAQEVEARGLPMELALLPFIESAFNPEAMSRVKASGMWQFMSATGKDFDLKQNLFRDDRRDVLASTRAALDYLSQLSRRYNGDWQLALAAYNWGMGNVDRAVKRNAAAGLSTAYEDLRMPTETADYVPKLQAVKNIVLRPEAYGLALPELENHPYFVTVNIERDIDVALAARLAGIDVDRFRQFNPQMNKPVILAAATPKLLLPFDNASHFVEALADHKGATASWTAWQVPRTMKAAEAAKQVGMTEVGLRELNRIPPRMLVKAGSTLLVPRTGKRDHDVSEHLAETAALALVADAPALRKRTITARKGDSLASLARRNGVSVAKLSEWNQLKPGAKVAAGAKFTVFVAPQRQASAKGSTSARKASSRAKPSKATATQRTKVSR